MSSHAPKIEMTEIIREHLRLSEGTERKLLEGTHACTWRSQTFEPFRDSAILTRDAGLRNHELYRTRVENQDCEFHDRTVVVTSCGRLCLYNEKINLSLSLAGQAVGVKEVDHGIAKTAGARR